MKVITFGYKAEIGRALASVCSPSFINKNEDGERQVVLSLSTNDGIMNLAHVHLSPTEARKLAEELIVYAREAEK